MGRKCQDFCYSYSFHPSFYDDLFLLDFRLFHNPDCCVFFLSFSDIKFGSVHFISSNKCLLLSIKSRYGHVCIKFRYIPLFVFFLNHNRNFYSTPICLVIYLILYYIEINSNLPSFLLVEM